MNGRHLLRRMLSGRFCRLPVAIAVFAFALPVVVGGVFAQSRALSESSLNVEGLNYESELTALFLGDFENARMEADSVNFLSLLESYINGFSRQCASYLPENRVEITESRCVEESVMVNGWGVEVGPRTCSRWENFGTGRYADPRLKRTLARLEAGYTPNFLRDVLLTEDPASASLGTSRRMMDVAISLGDDMTVLFEQNGCASDGIGRLQENMVRFAEGEPPLRLASGATLASLRSRGAPEAEFRDSDYQRLIDELVAENAMGWMINRYIAGSASQVSVTDRDSAGRPIQIRASYLYNGFEGQSRGGVTLIFRDGLPECLYFADAPQNCRLPSRRIITAYEKGEYR